MRHARSIALVVLALAVQLLLPVTGYVSGQPVQQVIYTRGFQPYAAAANGMILSVSPEGLVSIYDPRDMTQVAVAYAPAIVGESTGNPGWLSTLKVIRLPNLMVLVTQSGAAAITNDGKVVGRISLPDLRGFSVSDDLYMAAWNKRFVVVEEPWSYRVLAQYDAADVLFRIATSDPLFPNNSLAWAGTPVEDAVSRILSRFEALLNATYSSYQLIGYNATVSLAIPSNISRASLLEQYFNVTVASAGYLRGSALAAVNASFTVVVSVTALYNVTVVANGTVTYDTVPARGSDAYLITLGFLLDLTARTIVEAYGSVYNGYSGPGMSFSYEPLLSRSTRPVVLKYTSASGSLVDLPLPSMRPPVDVLFTGGYAVADFANASLVVDRASNTIVAALPVGSYTFAEDTQAGLALGYRVGSGFEVGVVRGSGLVDKIFSTSNTSVPTGVAYYRRIAVVTTFNPLSMSSTASYVALESTYPVTVAFESTLGGPVQATYRATISVDGFKFEYSGTGSYFTATALSGSALYVEASWLGYYSTAAAVIPGASTITVKLGPQPPGAGLVRQPAQVPPARYVVINESMLPAPDLGSWQAVAASGSDVFLARDGDLYVEVARYSLAAGRLVWSTKVPTVLGAVERLDIYGWTLVLYTTFEVFYIDAASGSVLGSLPKGTGQSLDPDSGYAASASGSAVYVLDLRRGSRWSFTALSDVQCVGVEGGSIVAVSRGSITVYDIRGAAADSKPLPPVPQLQPPYIVVAGPCVASKGWVAVTYSSYLPAQGAQATPPLVTSLLVSPWGQVFVFNGTVVAVRALASNPFPVPVRGPEVAAVALLDGATVRVYAVGVEARPVFEFPMASTVAVYDSAVVVFGGNATGFLRAYTFSGSTALHIVTRGPVVSAYIGGDVAAWAVRSAGPNSTYTARAVYGYQNLGVYSATISVNTPATVTIRELNFTTQVAGSITLLLAQPGTYTVEASAPHMVPRTVEFTVSPDSPSASVRVELQPRLYRVEVSVVDQFGRPAVGGVVEAIGPARASAALEGGRAVLSLPHGTYTIVFSHEFYSSASANITVDGDTGIRLEANRTRAVLTVRVVNQAGAAVPNATVTVYLGNATVARLQAPRGVASAALPISTTPYTVEAAAPGYTRAVRNVTLVDDVNTTIALAQFTGTISVVIVDDRGRPAAAVVRIIGPAGELFSGPAEGSVIVPAPAGAYTVEVYKDNNLVTSQPVVINENNPAATVTATVPSPPPPFYITYAPFLVIAVAAAAAVTLFMRLRRRQRVEKI